MAKPAVAARSQVAPEHTWNAPSVFPSVQAWEAEFQDIEAGLPLLESRKNTLHAGAAALLDALETVENVLRRALKLTVYANMSYSVDTGDQAAAGMYDRARGLSSRVLVATAFRDPELLALGRQTLDRWMKEDPRLAVYAHYVDNLFRRKAHVRSAEVEELMGMLADPFSGPRAGPLNALVLDVTASAVHLQLPFVVRSRGCLQLSSGHLSLIEEAMSSFHRYPFIMPTLACFESEVHLRADPACSCRLTSTRSPRRFAPRRSPFG